MYRRVGPTYGRACVRMRYFSSMLGSSGNRYLMKGVCVGELDERQLVLAVIIRGPMMVAVAGGVRWSCPC